MQTRESRQFKRVKLNTEVTAVVYAPNGEEEFVIKGLSVTISTGGIFFSSKLLLLQENTRIKVTFILPGYSSEIEAFGVVKYMYKVETKSIDEYNPGMGISFTEISEENIERIQNYVDSIQK